MFPFKNFNKEAIPSARRLDWQKEINKLPAYQRIVAYEKINSGKNYIIVSKKKGLIEVVNSQGKVLFSAPVGLGAGALRSEYKGKSDVLLKNVGNPTDDERHKFWRDNDITSAGVFTIGEIGGEGKAEYGNHTFVLKDQRGEKLGMLIHQNPGMAERKVKLDNISKALKEGKDPNPEDIYMSNGCLNVRPEDYKEIKKLVGIDSNVYILPDSKDVDIRLVEGKPALTVIGPTKANIQGKDVTLEYNTNKSWLTSTYGIKKETVSNIKQGNIGNIDDKNFEARQAFINGLNKHSSAIKSVYGLNEDEANQIAKMSYGIAGNESKWGTDYTRYGGLVDKEDAYKGQGIMGFLGLDNKTLSGIQEWKRNRGLLGMVEDVFSGNGMSQLVLNTANARPSHGITQMKYAPENPRFADYFDRQYNIFNGIYPRDRNLANDYMIRAGYDPEASAALTMGRLAENYINLRNRFNKENAAIDRQSNLQTGPYDYSKPETYVNPDFRLQKASNMFGGLLANAYGTLNTGNPTAFNGYQKILLDNNRNIDIFDFLGYTWQNPGQLRAGTATPDQNVYRKNYIANAQDLEIQTRPKKAVVVVPNLQAMGRF